MRNRIGFIRTEFIVHTRQPRLAKMRGRTGNGSGMIVVLELMWFASMPHGLHVGFPVLAFAAGYRSSFVRSYKEFEI